MAERSDAQATYWQRQIEMAQKDQRYRNWLDVGQKFYDRYTLEADGLGMHTSVKCQGGDMVYNLLWSNVQTQLPMLYSRLPEPYIARRFGNRDPVARMAGTLAERATMVDLEADDFDDQAERLALDYLIVGRGALRGIYESSVVNSRIPVREENREDGEPVFMTETGATIPGDMVERDQRGLFVIDPVTTDERAPLQYWFWRDLLIGPGRTWKDIQQKGWLSWTSYMTRADVAHRFGAAAAKKLSYTYSPFSTHEKKAGRKAQSDGRTKLARVDEIWHARSRQIFWIGEGSERLLDKETDRLDLVGFYNTPRPLVATTGNNGFVPTPDYAEYRSQAAEMDQITAKIETIMEEIRAGGVYDLSIPSLGSALRKKQSSWTGIDNWAAFASSGGMKGSVQDFDNKAKIEAVLALYQHRQATKRDADEVAGIIDLFRGQQTQEDETLGQSEMRAATGGLRINDKQRDFQRYLSDALRIKTEIIVSQFDSQRLLQMADAPALIQESPDVSRVTLMAESDQFKQAAQQNPNLIIGAQQALQAAVVQQTNLIQQAVAMLQNDRMRTFKLDIETDATVALDENMEKQQAGEFVKVVGDFLERVFSSEAIGQNPELKPLAGEMLMFVVRRFKIGRSLEQKIEETIKGLITAPQQPQQPDPLTLDVQRQAKDDQMDAAHDARQDQIDAFNAATKRMEVQTKAAQAAKDGNLKDLELANKILDSDGIGGNA